MSPKPCPACGHQVSRSARTCPSCGHAIRKKSNPFTWMLFAILVFILIATFLHA